MSHSMFLSSARNSCIDSGEIHRDIDHDKGQLISKCLFGVLNSPKKPTKTIRLEVP